MSVYTNMLSDTGEEEILNLFVFGRILLYLSTISVSDTIFFNTNIDTYLFRLIVSKMLLT